MTVEQILSMKISKVEFTTEITTNDANAIVE